MSVNVASSASCEPAVGGRFWNWILTLNLKPSTNMKMTAKTKNLTVLLRVAQKDYISEVSESS